MKTIPSINSARFNSGIASQRRRNSSPFRRSPSRSTGGRMTAAVDIAVIRNHHKRPVQFAGPTVCFRASPIVCRLAGTRLNQDASKSDASLWALSIRRFAKPMFSLRKVGQEIAVTQNRLSMLGPSLGQRQCQLPRFGWFRSKVMPAHPFIGWIEPHAKTFLIHPHVTKGDVVVDDVLHRRRHRLAQRAPAITPDSSPVSERSSPSTSNSHANLASLAPIGWPMRIVKSAGSPTPLKPRTVRCATSSVSMLP